MNIKKICISAAIIVCMIFLYSYASSFYKEKVSSMKYCKMCGCKYIYWANGFDNDNVNNKFILYPDEVSSEYSQSLTYGNTNGSNVLSSDNRTAVLTINGCELNQLKGNVSRLTGYIKYPKLEQFNLEILYRINDEDVQKSLGIKTIAGTGDWKKFQYYIDLTYIDDLYEMSIVIQYSEEMAVDEFEICKYNDGKIINESPILKNITFTNSEDSKDYSNILSLTPNYDSHQSKYTVYSMVEDQDIYIKTLPEDDFVNNSHEIIENDLEIRVNGSLVNKTTMLSQKISLQELDKQANMVKIELKNKTVSECPAVNYYMFEFKAEPSVVNASNAALRNIISIDGNFHLDPLFASSTEDYNGVVTGENIIKIRPVPSNPDAIVSVNGTAFDSDEQEYIEIDLNSQSVVDIDVESVNGEETKRYTISFTDINWVRLTGLNGSLFASGKEDDEVLDIEVEIDEIPDPGKVASVSFSSRGLNGAVYGDDYVIDGTVSGSGTITWESDDSRIKTIPLHILEDHSGDAGEGVEIVLNESENVTAIKNNVFVYEIVDDEMRVRYVRANQDRDPSTLDGRTWETAYRYLQDAFYEMNEEGVTIHQVRIGAGEYYPDESSKYSVVPYSFEIKHSLILRGGYSPNGGYISDNEEYSTVLSGEIDQNSDIDDNVRICYIGGNNYNNVYFEGIVFSEGNGRSGSGGYGGGNASIGGAIRASSVETDIHIYKCKFIDNYASHFGGVIYCENSGDILEVEESIFKRNSSTTLGGAIMIGGISELKINSSVFEENSCVGGNGGAIYCDNDLEQVSVNNTVFDNNIAESGGACFINAGMPAFVSIINCVFTRNGAEGDMYSSKGGALYFSSVCENANITNCTLFENKAQINGGGIFYPLSNYQDELKLYNTILYNNYKSDQETGNYDVLNSFNNANNFIKDANWIEENESGTPNFNDIANLTGGDEWCTENDGLILKEEDINCKDAGDNSYIDENYDITNRNRIVNTVDIGAYETQ